MDRVRRTLAERLVFRRVLRCTSCGFKSRTWRRPFESTWVFIASRYTRCVQCGSPRVRKLPTRDRIDRMSSHPLSLLSGLSGAPIYHCNPCRLQYRDWRGVEPEGEFGS